MNTTKTEDDIITKAVTLGEESSRSWNLSDLLKFKDHYMSNKPLLEKPRFNWLSILTKNGSLSVLRGALEFLKISQEDFNQSVINFININNYDIIEEAKKLKPQFFNEFISKISTYPFNEVKKYKNNGLLKFALNNNVSLNHAFGKFNELRVFYEEYKEQDHDPLLLKIKAGEIKYFFRIFSSEQRSIIIKKFIDNLPNEKQSEIKDLFYLHSIDPISKGNIHSISQVSTLFNHFDYTEKEYINAVELIVKVIFEDRIDGQEDKVNDLIEFIIRRNEVNNIKEYFNTEESLSIFSMVENKIKMEGILNEAWDESEPVVTRRRASI